MFIATRLPDSAIAGNTKGMAPQSQTPHILLTRPMAQSQRLARSLRTAFGAPLHIVISPLMQVAFLKPALPDITPAGLIFSSETAVAAYAQLEIRPVCPAWCIGPRTAKAAQRAGSETVFTARNAADLIAHIIHSRPIGPFLHLRGEDSVGNISVALTAAGIPTDAAVIYAQRSIALTTRALHLLSGTDRVTVPLFSARSAALFATATQPSAPLDIIAFSPTVAAALPAVLHAHTRTSPHPEAKAMMQTILSSLMEPSFA